MRGAYFHGRGVVFAMKSFQRTFSTRYGASIELLAAVDKIKTHLLGFPQSNIHTLGIRFSSHNTLSLINIRNTEEAV